MKPHLQAFFQNLHTNHPSVCVFEISDGGASCIIIEIIAKDSVNMANLMQTFENLLLGKYSTEFFDIAHNIGYV